MTLAPTSNRTSGSTPDRDPTRDRLRCMFHGALGIPFVEGNAVRVYRNGVEIFPAMLEAIGASEHTIEFETYVYWEGDIARRMARALADASERGVDVRVLLDGLGAAKMDDEARATLDRSGVRVCEFQPLRPSRLWRVTHRTHRKILVCDGRIGFTGGVGIASQWEGDARNPEEWRETHFRIEGPAATALRAAFFDHWLASDEDVDVIFPCALLERDDHPAVCEPAGDIPIQVVPSEATGRWSRQRTIYRAAIRGARERLRIVTAYFVPDEDLIELLVDAARRGVDVRILLPGPHIDFTISQLAGEAVYERLLDSGIRIWRYQPTMIHAKVLTVDGTLACIGSANMNHRSLMKDDEISLAVLDERLVADLEADFESDLARSVEVGPDHEWDDRSWWRKLLAWASRLVKGEL